MGTSLIEYPCSSSYSIRFRSAWNCLKIRNTVNLGTPEPSLRVYLRDCAQGAPLRWGERRGMLLHFVLTTLHSLLPLCNFPCQNPISCIASFSLPVSHRRPKFALSCSHSFFIPNSSASQYPCLRTGCSYIGAHANDLIPHTKKFTCQCLYTG